MALSAKACGKAIDGTKPDHPTHTLRHATKDAAACECVTDNGSA